MQAIKGNYHPEPYWSRVAAEIGNRSERKDVAGDDDPYFRYKREKFMERFLDSLAVEGKIVAEVGCGPGGNLAHLARSGPAALHGVDISAAMLELAAVTTRAHSDLVALHKTDGLSIPLLDASVDLSFTVTVLQHNTDASMLKALIAEICRFTRSTVVIMEDTGEMEDSPAASDRDHIARRRAIYAAEFESHGFFRTRPDEFLNLRASRWFQERAERLRTPRQQEGAPVPAFFKWVLAVGIGVTRRLDPLLTENAGLTRMEFGKRR
jgi:SAM-dependent methyltransferase